MAGMKSRPLWQDFDSIQYSMSDIHTVPRGKVVPATYNGPPLELDLFNGTPFVGPRCELPMSIPEMSDTYPSYEWRPDPETLTPWPWVSSEGHRVGNILCDMYRPDGSPYLNCPRQLLKAQVNALKKEHQLEIKTAFEYEFFAFKENTLEPLGSDTLQFLDLRVHGKHHAMFGELRSVLEAMGVTVRTIQAEFPPGQWELTTVPVIGVAGGDVGFYVKNTVKGFLQTKGYDATFMTRPTLSGIGSGLHLNHSLWSWKTEKSTPEGTAQALETNVLKCENINGPESCLSDTARHWLAGLMLHGPALTALLCPTVNCYRRLYNLCAPSASNWGMGDRNAVVRVRTTPSNFYLENRLPGAAANPYIALAATIAAGRDGLARRLECPPPMDKHAQALPKSLHEALTCLEQDAPLTELLGSSFVSDYISAKRELEVDVHQRNTFSNADEEIKFERDVYFKTY